MDLVENQSTIICEKVQDHVTRVNSLKNHLAKQTYRVRLEHYWELENIRKRLKEFKWRIEQLEATGDLHMSHRGGLLGGTGQCAECASCGPSLRLGTK